jgi:hypothetical protein
VIDGPETADAVATEIMKTPVRSGSTTSIFGAINFAMPLFERKSLALTRCTGVFHASFCFLMHFHAISVHHLALICITSKGLLSEYQPDRNSSMAATSKEIEAGAKAIAEDLHLPGGGLKKLARVVEDHLGWFDTVEARGLTWADMSRLLFAAGAKAGNGRPFSVGTLYSTVWRKREDAKHIDRGTASSSKSTTGIQGSTQESPARKGRSDGAPTQNGNVKPLRKPRQARRSTFEEPERRSKKVEKKQVKTSKERSSPTQPVKTQPKASSKKDLLAFMHRSAAVFGIQVGEVDHLSMPAGLRLACRSSPGMA